MYGKKNMDSYLLEKINEVEDLHWWWEGRRQLIKWLLGNKNYKRILDVGCGTGETLVFLKTLFPKTSLYGVDSYQKSVGFTKQRGIRKIFKANATKLPFKNNFFDAVLLLDVLEHIENDGQAIYEAKRVLKKNGKIIITTPALSFIWSDHDINQGHQRRYTRRQIRRLAKNAGLKVAFISYFNFFLSPPIILIRLLSRLRVFKFFTRYNNGINFDIVRVEPINFALKTIFVREIKALRFLRYPLGVSISAVFKT